MKTNRTMKRLAGLAFLIMAAPVWAQGNNSYIDQVSYVTVYEDCNFRGRSETLKVGEYRDVDRLRVRNDSISSFRIPRNMELEVFQHDNFDGFNTKYYQDEPCLEDSWKDEISSLIVHRKGNSNNFDRNANSSQYDYLTEQGVTGLNLSRLQFEGHALEKIGQKEWKLSGDRRTTEFTELRKNVDTIHLRRKDGEVNLRIDLYDRDVGVSFRDGQRASYKIDRAWRTNETYRPNKAQQLNRYPNREHPRHSSQRPYTNQANRELRRPNLERSQNQIQKPVTHNIVRTQNGCFLLYRHSDWWHWRIAL